MNEEFLDAYKEHMDMVSKAIENLAGRIIVLEQAMGKMPQPGADMMKYKPEGYEEHLNMKELLDDLYMKINMMEDRVNQHNIP
jgi:hypothetical protein|tara:strand:+ start:4926 stop:5174 length:249 start_codon:yes stop_codon:yes gene_type:complete